MLDVRINTNKNFASDINVFKSLCVSFPVLHWVSKCVKRRSKIQLIELCINKSCLMCWCDRKINIELGIIGCIKCCFAVHLSGNTYQISVSTNLKAELIFILCNTQCLIDELYLSKLSINIYIQHRRIKINLLVWK